MMRTLLKTLLAAIVVASLLSGCFVAAHGPYGHAGISAAPSSQAQSGPPSHAKAYGHRAKYHYHYYPDSYLYFDINRSLYFYLENGSWTMAATLPSRLHVSLGDRVSLEMDIDRPYVKYDDHREKYPGKKHKGEKHKRKGKKNKKEKRYKDDDRDD